jgi:hypothetical protein
MRKIYWQIGSIVSLLVINTFWSFEPAKACSCDDPGSPQEAMKGSSRTFIGRVLRSEEDPKYSGELITTFAVSRVWKGKRQSRIIIHTRRPRPAGCGIGFEVGVEYLVFSDTYDGNKEGTSGCSRTSRLEHFSPAEIRTLGKGRIVR